MDMNVNDIIKAAKKVHMGDWVDVLDLEVLDSLIKESEIRTCAPGRVLFLRNCWQRCYRVRQVAGGYEVRLLGPQGQLAPDRFLSAGEMTAELERCEVRTRQFGR